MEDPNAFLTVDNFKVCKAILQLYMQDKYAFDITTRLPEDGLNKLLYQVMREVHVTATAQQRSKKEANNLALNVIKDRLVVQYGLATAQAQQQAGKLQMQTLDRETSVFGARPLPDGTALQAEPASVRGDEGDKLLQTYDALVQQRLPPAQAQAAAAAAQQQVNQKVDPPLPAGEFAKRMAELERMRGSEAAAAAAAVASAATAAQQATPLAQPDPAALFRLTQGVAQQPPALPGGVAGNAAAAAAPTHNSMMPAVVGKTLPPVAAPLRDYQNFNQDALAAPLPLPSRRTVTRYLTINAADRNWVQDPLRFQFSAGYLVQNGWADYKNICAIEFTRLILPLEIKEARTITNVPKQNFQHGFDFAYPYVVLSIPELDAVCDGLGTRLKAQALFVMSGDYCSSNGRGYLLLDPMQKEQILYTPTPLAALPRLTVRILKPNGALFNQSRDHHAVQLVAYDSFNATYLKVVLTRYYDKNEFYQGDFVLLRGYAAAFAAGDPAATPAAVAALAGLVVFLNRLEGHEILEIGQPNEYGFYNSFSIQAPGAFDALSGRYEPDAAALAALSEFNTGCGLLAPGSQNGVVLNASLQPVVSMQVRTLEGDAASVLQVSAV
jgi:hypothetical protein